MHSPPPFPHSATWHTRSSMEGVRAEGQLAATERERVAEWSAAVGQNALLLVSPYPQVFQFRPSSIEQRVPFISLISFRAVKSGLPSALPFLSIPHSGCVLSLLTVTPSVASFRHASSMRCPSPLWVGDWRSETRRVSQPCRSAFRYTNFVPSLALYY